MKPVRFKISHLLVTTMLLAFVLAFYVQANRVRRLEGTVHELSNIIAGVRCAVIPMSSSRDVWLRLIGETIEEFNERIRGDHPEYVNNDPDNSYVEFLP